MFHILLDLVWLDLVTLFQQLTKRQVDADHVPGSIEWGLCLLTANASYSFRTAL